MSSAGRNAVPDFKHVVDKAIALFAVYAGATLSFFVKDFLFDDMSASVRYVREQPPS